MKFTELYKHGGTSQSHLKKHALSQILAHNLKIELTKIAIYFKLKIYE